MSNRQQKSRDLIRLYHHRQNNGGRANTKNPYAVPITLDAWMTHFDNLFAKTVFGMLDNEEICKLAPAYPVLTSLCQECSSPETGLFSRGSFSVSYEKANTTQTICALCAIMYDKMSSMTGDNKIKTMLQEGSSFTTARGEPPLFSWVVGPSPGRSCISSPMHRVNQGRRPKSFLGHLPERISGFTDPW